MKKMVLCLMFLSIALYSNEFKGVKLIKLNESQLINLGIYVRETKIDYIEKNLNKNAFKKIVVENGNISTKNCKAKDKADYQGIQPRLVEYNFGGGSVCYFSKVNDFKALDSSDKDFAANNSAIMAELNNLIGIQYEFIYKTKKENQHHTLIFWYPPTKELINLLPDNKGFDLGKVINSEINYSELNESSYQNNNLNSNMLKITNLYPNPLLGGSVNLEYNLSDDKFVSILVYDVAGHMITNLLSEQLQSAGNHKFNFGIDDLINGTYIISIVTNTGETVYTRLIKLG